MRRDEVEERIAEELDDYVVWMATLMADGLLLAAMVVVSAAVATLEKQLQLEGIDEFLYTLFQVVLGISTLLPPLGKTIEHVGVILIRIWKRWQAEARRPPESDEDETEDET